LREGDVHERLSAVIPLSSFPREVADPALRDALADPEDEVKVAAFGGLWSVRGLKRVLISTDGAAWKIVRRIVSADDSERREGLAELVRMFGEIDAGKSPESLGLV
jgi:hypothetical protein